MIKFEDSINRMRREIGQIHTLIKCKYSNTFTDHQLNIKNKFQKKYGNTKTRTLEYKLAILKHDLKATCAKFKYSKRKHQRKVINKKFSRDPKGVYRNFKGTKIKVQNLASKDEVQSFWKSVWCKNVTFNKDAPWIKGLATNYCKDTIGNAYSIDLKTLSTVINRINPSKIPGRDLISGFWYKNLEYYRKNLMTLFQNTYDGEIDFPNWLSLAKTTLIPKNEKTHIPKNYRPIACLNLMYKIYTGCLNSFLQEHCIRNNNITPEQAGGKPEVWGCIEQLLLNKSILNEVKHKKRNLITIWLDYQKAFDSIPHDWMIQSLRLAKIPEGLIAAIEILTKQWATIVQLNGNQSSITSDVIKFSNGIFQGDSMSVLLFILSLNPLSYMLGKVKGYNYGNDRQKTITHNFFVDDLKLYGSTINVTKKQLDLVTQFSEDICMNFGVDKCAYLRIEKGKIVNDGEPIVMNNLTVNAVREGDTYKYLGIDENISYHGPINKERVSKEYFTRTRKIWSSELSAYNKVIAHNSFAVPVLISTVGVLDWNISEIQGIDIKTRKILTLSRSFHPNSDVDRLYMQKQFGGRGLRQVQSSYESRIIAIRQHLLRNSEQNNSLEYIGEKESNGILRLGQELLQKYNIISNRNEAPKSVSKKFTKADQTSKRENFLRTNE